MDLEISKTFLQMEFFSFTQLLKQFNVPLEHFLRYLQILHFVKSRLPLFPELPETPSYSLNVRCVVKKIHEDNCNVLSVLWNTVYHSSTPTTLPVDCNSQWEHISTTSRASCLYLLAFSILFYKCSMCSHLPIIQSVLTQLLPHVSDQHTRQSQQGLGISQLEQSDYSLTGCVSNNTQIYTNIWK